MTELAAIARQFDAAFAAALPKRAERFAAPYLPGASAALFALSVAERTRLALVVLNASADPERLLCDLEAFAGKDVNLLHLPLPLKGDAETQGLRVGVIRSLMQRKPNAPTVLVVPLAALCVPVPEPDAVEAAVLQFKPGKPLPVASLAVLLEQLTAWGYSRTIDIEAPAQVAVRGGIVDIWKPGDEQPVRLELFGDEVESLRRFDPATQRSSGKLDELTLVPCTDGALPLVQLADVLPRGAGIVWLNHTELQEQTELLHLESRTLPNWTSLLKRFRSAAPALEFFSGEPPYTGLPDFPLEVAPFPGVVDDGAAVHHPELLVRQRRSILENLAARTSEFPTVMCADTPGTLELLEREAPAGSALCFVLQPLSGGFVMPTAVVAAQPDLYAVRKQNLHRPVTVARQGVRVEQLNELSPGDLVVHVDHGIGRFIGSTEIEVNGVRSEVFSIEYAEGAKLHVPVSQANLISRYVGVGGGRATKLHKLGGARWTKEKATAERAVQDLAASLLETQARRNVLKGFAFDVNPTWLHEFESAFPYQETPDQVRVIAEVKEDMASTRPMDRLICGDAGYGKTEIAMRAAFVAVMNQKQVAVLVPTTILCEQHYETFCERMAAYPIRIAAVSRFRSPATRRQILEDAAAGQIDIVIGTHALLQEQVSFKDLGLLVIDEEQRFGVGHKERLKQMRGLVDVLTLSATPIPRTLYMSMTAARDMSLLQTPPRERQAIDTKVVRDSDTTLRTAILQEINRNGQVYFLYNRVLTIRRMLERLTKLVPEAKIGVAHGQMASRELEDVMLRFERGEINVLLCTTIVENGLDIPHANTIIVHRADRFGISDLYQLRGRVGRSMVKAFAWLLLPDHGYMDEEARRRIQALRKHSGPGAGFNLALRDLEIRGAGNLLGHAQSGHIAAVGFGLYCQLLKRTVARMKGEPPPLLVDVTLQLDFVDLSPGLFDDEFSACIPYEFIDDDAHRMRLHRRCAEATSEEEVDALRAEIADVYGKLPEAVNRLLQLCRLRIRAARKQIMRVEVKGMRAQFFHAKTRAPILIRGNPPHVSGKTPDQKIRALLHLLEHELSY